MEKGSRMKPKDYIEEWYQEAITPQYSSILQEILAANLKVKMISHVLMHHQVHFANLDMNILESLNCKWIHWKHSYT